jgi:hypothetical protein
MDKIKFASGEEFEIIAPDYKNNRCAVRRQTPVDARLVGLTGRAKQKAWLTTAAGTEQIHAYVTNASTGEIAVMH